MTRYPLIDGGKYLVLDVETTTIHKGHVFTPENKLLLVGCRTPNVSCVYNIEYNDEPFGGALQHIQTEIDDAGILIFFNAKFDLHWLRRYGVKFNHKKIWDCQLVDFILGSQLNKMPSLNEVCARNGLGQKHEIDWENPPPYEEFCNYLGQDLFLTEEIYLKQQELIKGKEALIELNHEDLLVLEEMEWNGLKYDVEKSLELGKKLQEEVDEIYRQLNSLVGCNFINWNSNDHASVILYGGTIKTAAKEVAGVYATGNRAGQIKYKNIQVEHTFPRLIEPLRGSALKKDGYYSTDEKTLLQLRASGKSKQIILSLLTATKKEKLKGTYAQGIPSLIQEMGWEGNIIHGQLNQTVAVTGRLSSSKPNMQNFTDEITSLIISRYD